MNDEAPPSTAPSPEVAQLVLLGQVEDAVTLHAKQAAISPDEARALVEALAS